MGETTESWKVGGVRVTSTWSSAPASTPTTSAGRRTWTPGHTSLWIEWEGEAGPLTGDVVHHPLQFADPALAFVSDEARGTRDALVRRVADQPVTTFGSHFASAPAGRVVPVAGGASWRFDPA